VSPFTKLETKAAALMDVYQAVFLGIVQALTEFLPVSSSGHLVIFQNFLGLREPQLLFDISVHLGTLGAVLWVFRSDIRRMIIAVPRIRPSLIVDAQADPDARLAVFIIVGSIPTAIIGLALHRFTDTLFASPALVGYMLLITGALLWAVRQQGRHPGGDTVPSIRTALWIGLIQGLAVIPGISRSGSTIAAGLYLGMDRDAAARFSFLLSIPAISGAGLLNAADLATQPVDSLQIAAIGVLTAGAVGYVSLKVLLRIVKRGRLHLFAPYCWVIGMLALFSG
jgi:undecaprenyl-diphosphatase